MRYKICFLWILLVFSSCKSDIILVSSVKEIIIPGVKTKSPYIQYVIQIKLEKDHSIEIDRFDLSQSGVTSDNCEYYLKDHITGTNKKKAQGKGIYDLIIIPKKVYQKQLNEKDSLKIFYKLNDQNKDIVVTTFTTKITRKR